MISGQIIDAVLLIYIGYAIVVGFMRGFFNVFVGIFGIYGASLLAWLFQEKMLVFSTNVLGISAKANPSIIYIFVWLFFYLVITVAAKILTGVFKLTGVSIMLRLTGAVFNGVKAVMITVVVLTFISNLNNDLFEATGITGHLTKVGAKVTNLYSESIDENKVEVIKEVVNSKEPFIIDDDFRYNLLER